VPPALAAHFTTGELAVLKVISDEWLAHGTCNLNLNKIAARGVCRKLAKQAVGLAEKEHSLITVQRRPGRAASISPTSFASSGRSGPTGFGRGIAKPTRLLPARKPSAGGSGGSTCCSSIRVTPQGNKPGSESRFNCIVRAGQGNCFGSLKNYAKTGSVIALMRVAARHARKAWTQEIGSAAPAMARLCQ
jgi:hypothetical protein